MRCCERSGATVRPLTLLPRRRSAAPVRRWCGARRLRRASCCKHVSSTCACNGKRYHIVYGHYPCSEGNFGEMWGNVLGFSHTPVSSLPMPTTNITLTHDQAARLAAILDNEVASNKNRLVSATLSEGDYREQAQPLAGRIAADELIRANLRRQGVK